MWMSYPLSVPRYSFPFFRPTITGDSSVLCKRSSGLSAVILISPGFSKNRFRVVGLVV